MPALVFSLLGFGACSNAQAVCSYPGLDGGFGEIKLMQASADLLNYKFWFEDSKNPYPNETLMMLKEIPLKPSGCDQGTFPAEFTNKRLRMVYFPPSSATAIGSRFRIPSTSQGVAFDVELPGKGPSFETGGIEIGRSKGAVLAGGSLPITRAFDNFVLRVSMVKTGPFSATSSNPHGQYPVSIRLGSEQLGSFKFYSEDGTTSTRYEERIGFPDQQVAAGQRLPWIAYAGAPACGFVSVPSTTSTIKLADVSQQRFKAVGPIEDGAKTQDMKFRCWGGLSTRPIVTFEATYPLVGAVGVGMQSASSDVGVQIFLDDQPVPLGKELGIAITMNPFPKEFGVPDPTSSGHFCVTNCGSDMSGPQWLDGKSGLGEATASFRFKYYQTTTKKPEVQQVLVPFSITIDVP